MTSTATPPRIVDDVLRLMLPTHDRDAVSGDLLEEYRETIFPARGHRSADLWFIGQVAGILLRRHWVWALLLGTAFVVRTGYDWLEPTSEFAARSSVSTAVGVSILLCAGFVATWRSGSAWTGALAGFTTALMASVVSLSGAALLLAFRHDQATMMSIRGSGGLAEVFTLPVMLLVPAVPLGTLGGACAKTLRMLVRASS